MKILTAAEMAEVDRLTTERYLMPSILLMENAGRCFVDELENHCPGLLKKHTAILCGGGNNGGDGCVIARYLANRGAAPSLLLFSDPGKLKGDALINWNIAETMGFPVTVLENPVEGAEYLNMMPTPDIIVDALFGTGLAKPIGPDFEYIVEWINRLSARSLVASVDIPSGIMADAARIPGPAVKARLTVSFSALKPALVLSPAADCAGRVVVADIGSPPALLDNPQYLMNLADAGHVRRVLQSRNRESHKGTFGHIHMIAGSRGKSGAALMAGMAALRSGAGLVTMWLPERLEHSVAGRFPELMMEFLPETEEGTLDHSGYDTIMNQINNADAMLLGPGMTTHPSTAALIRKLVLSSPVPVILDADGINAFSSSGEYPRNESGQPVIITPHPGEMARLTGSSIAHIQENRLNSAQEYAARYDCHVVLKGYQTVIAAPEGTLFINTTGNPGMATGGTGDILAGIIGRFVAGWKLNQAKAERSNLMEAIAAGVYLHGLAGDLAAESGTMESLVATDLLTYLSAAFKKSLGAEN
jgi:ADP-dependent NAD(P)H-hydrate dehydratase / NAD(P)H-hydrate epimerase